MNTYEFKLVFKLQIHQNDPASHIEALAKAGCDDALVGLGRTGRIALDFAREARSAKVAVRSAINDVRKAIPQATLIEAAPDFVSITDAADVAGFTRQNMRKLVVNNDDTFPTPVHEGSPSIWHLAKVLRWLRDHNGRSVDPLLLETADFTMRINVAREALLVKDVLIPKDLMALFCQEPN